MPNIYEMTSLRVLLVICVPLLCHCAGPTSPFGSPQMWSESFGNLKRLTKASPVKIKFYPHSQVLHGKSDFAAVIEDPMGISSDYRIRLFYNNLDVTDRFLAQSKIAFLNSDHTKLEISISNVRIQPFRENKIYLGYMRNINTHPVFAKYNPPHCLASDKTHLASTHEFEISDEMRRLLQATAEVENINPNYVAGLIAQESSFDIKAVSWAKALGLTQITPLGEAEVIKSHEGWPQYPGIGGMTPVMLKYLVARNRINGKNEWRLNPTLSIKGGITYIRYLNSYWEKPENMERVKKLKGKREDILSALILASYNSGPARVNYAIERFGDEWLNKSPELSEARTYVTRVTSFCDYFSQSEEEPL